MNEAKRQLRLRMRERLRGVSAEERRAAGEAVMARVRAMPEWQAARMVMLFTPLADEMDLTGLMQGEGKRVCVPRVASADPPEMVAVEVPGPPPAERQQDIDTAVGWARGRFGNFEPVGRAVDPAEIRFVLLPALAFTPHCTRLGRGKGFYDRFLDGIRSSSFLCGVGHGFQVVDALPVEAHDVRLDAVVTPNGVYRRTGVDVDR